MNTQVDERAREWEAARRRMFVANQIDLLINEMIRQIRQLLKDTGVASSQMEKHQFSNLLGVARDTQSVELIKNFIHYQMGRDVRGTTWRANDFGERLIQDLEGLRERARGIAENVYRELRLAGMPDNTEVDAVWIEAARHYLGQLNRYFYYKKEAQRWSKR